MFWSHQNRSRKIMWGLFWVLLGLLILLANHGLLGYDFAFSRDWPILLIAVGVMKLVDLLAWRDGRCCRTVKIIHGGEDTASQPSSGPSKAEILKAVEDGTMTADEAAKRLRGI